jgi:hypothetical protein
MYTLSGFVQKFCTAIVAEALPMSKNLGQRGSCKRLYIWESSDEDLVFWYNPVHLCLLEHDF